MYRALHRYVKADAAIEWSGPVATHAAMRSSPAIIANARYFDTPSWAKGYLDGAHRDTAFKERWALATGSWDDRVVIDIGCGPGNLFATLGGRPAALIGVDVSRGSLEMAQAAGYEPLLADAHDLPLASGIADIVAINATLHHCDDMARVLKEAARLVAPGGVLVTDHDPQLSAWDFRGLGLSLWRLRMTVYPWLKKGFHATAQEQSAAIASEIHHRPGDGVTRALFEETLAPLGFEVAVYPHNHKLGGEVLDQRWGRSEFKFRIAQRLSSIDPDTAEAALSLMCCARLTTAGA
jgi:SAM-dependent methyltransferase